MDYYILHCFLLVCEEIESREEVTVTQTGITQEKM